MKENIFGEGLDIPMLGIRKTCEELWPDKTLDLFKDPVFQISNHFKLSTSQVGVSCHLTIDTIQKVNDSKQANKLKQGYSLVSTYRNQDI